MIFFTMATLFPAHATTVYQHRRRQQASGIYLLLFKTLGLM